MSEPLRFEEPEPQVGFEADLHVVPDIDESTARPDPDGVAARVGDLYMRHSAQLSTFAYELSPDDPDLAEDAIQEAFCAVAATPSPDDADAGSWLFSAVEQYVQGQSYGADALRETPAGLKFPVTRPEATDSAEQVFIDSVRSSIRQQTMAQLTDREHQLLDLHYRQGMRLNEAAEVIGISAGNARITKLRLLRWLEPLVTDSTLDDLQQESVPVPRPAGEPARQPRLPFNLQRLGMD